MPLPPPPPRLQGEGEELSQDMLRGAHCGSALLPTLVCFFKWLSHWFVHNVLVTYPLPFLSLMQGDSGGPLMCRPPGASNHLHWYQVGVVSWGRSCGAVRAPGIYARVANYHSWIEATSAQAGRPFRVPQNPMSNAPAHESPPLVGLGIQSSTSHGPAHERPPLVDLGLDSGSHRRSVSLGMDRAILIAGVSLAWLHCGWG